MSSGVEVQVVRVGKLTAVERAQMEALYRAHYEGAADAAFARDLAAKDLTILLKDGGQVCGFSTVVVYPFEGMRILFSGDTVVDAAHRNQTGLAGAFGHVMRHFNEIGGDPLYWFLVCKGARTYRFLPTFFKRFTPGAVDEHELATRLRRVAAARFPDEYDAATGVLHFTGETDRLKTDVLRMDEESVRFRTLNPGWAKGEELCCFVPLAMDNLNRLGERVIAAVEPKWRV